MPSNLGKIGFIPPALRPLEFNMPDVDWAHNYNAPEDYSSNIQNLWKLQNRLNHLPGISIDRIQADTYINIVSNFLIAFEQTTTPISNFGQLVSISGDLRDVPLNLLENSTVVGLTGTENLYDVTGAGVSFDVPAYRMLPPKFTNYIGVNLLLLPSHLSTNLAHVYIQPLDTRSINPKHYWNAYTSFAETNIPAFFKMHEEWIYLMLGQYDKTAFDHAKEPLSSDVRKKIFPQIGFKFMPKEPEVSHGPVLWSNYDTAYKNAIEEEIKRTITFDEENWVNDKYTRMLGELKVNASVFPRFTNDYKMIDEYLTKEKREFISGALGDYVLRAIRTGHIPELNGIGDTYLELGIEYMEIMPENAKRIRELQENLDPNFVEVLESIVKGSGYFNQDIRRFYTPKPGSHLDFSDTQTYPINMNLNLPAKELTRLQNELMDLTVMCVQDQLRSEVVTPDTVREIFEYIEIIRLMNGTHGYIGSCDGKTAAFLTSWLELNMGKELEFMKFKFETYSMQPKQYRESLGVYHKKALEVNYKKSLRN